MMFDIFHQNVQFRLEFKAVVLQRLYLAEKHFHLTMFLDPLADDADEFLISTRDQSRIEDRFLDMSMNFQLGFDGFEKRRVTALFAGFNLFKKFADLVVIGF